MNHDLFLQLHYPHLSHPSWLEEEQPFYLLSLSALSRLPPSIKVYNLYARQKRAIALSTVRKLPLVERMNHTYPGFTKFGTLEPPHWLILN